MFNIEDFNIKLDTEEIGRNFVYCAEINSTNSFLLEDEEFKKNGTVILAEYQTNGRGRLTREWQSAKDLNLTFSILLNKGFESVNPNIINLTASLAVAMSIENLYQLPVELKWPNDVLVNSKKIAGILLESTSKGSKLDKIVIGFGINVNQTSFTGKFIIPPTSVRNEFHSVASRERTLSEMLNNFEELLEVCKAHPWKILEDWKNRCKMLGEKIKVDAGEGKTKFGKFKDIDDSGFMILEVSGRDEKIHFGDVSIR